MDEIKTELKNLGLTDKETSVYLSSLELGPASVQDISHKSKVNRATTYVMIESLSARGLMSTFTKGKKKFYSPESPERLLSIIENKQRELKNKQGELEKVLPMLVGMFNAEGVKPQVRYLEGMEGVETVRQIFERLGGDYVQIFPLLDAEIAEEYVHGKEVHRKQLRHHHVSEGTDVRKLIVMDEINEEKLPDITDGEARFLSSSDFPIHAEITVRGGHVFLVSYKSSVMAAVIISQEIADAVRALFELAWKGASSAVSKKSHQ
jgi:HTH-type transcriptional regulator, sugar sensing transcriptional regulator